MAPAAVLAEAGALVGTTESVVAVESVVATVVEVDYDELRGMKPDELRLF